MLCVYQLIPNVVTFALLSRVTWMLIIMCTLARCCTLGVVMCILRQTCSLGVVVYITSVNQPVL